MTEIPTVITTKVNCRLAADDVLYFDDTIGLLVFGGSELNPSFQGYIGQAVLYRHKAISALEVTLTRLQYIHLPRFNL